MATWDPTQYGRFFAERARPFDELVARIPTTEAVAVVDLGCGAGVLTARLAARYPDAAVLGLDSSPEMIAAAAPLATPQLSFQLGDLGTWQPPRRSVDVIVANAALQWVPDHETLLTNLAGALDDGGTLAFQVPVRGPRFGDDVSVGPRGSTPVKTPEWYVRTLSAHGLSVDAWETTYFHVLPGEDAVFEWFAGSGLRPYLATATPEQVEALKAQLRDSYPQEPFGTILPFPRLFVVARRS